MHYFLLYGIFWTNPHPWISSFILLHLSWCIPSWNSFFLYLPFNFYVINNCYQSFKLSPICKGNPSISFGITNCAFKYVLYLLLWRQYFTKLIIVSPKDLAIFVLPPWYIILFLSSHTFPDYCTSNHFHYFPILKGNKMINVPNFFYRIEIKTKVIIQVNKKGLLPLIK